MSFVGADICESGFTALDTTPKFIHDARCIILILVMTISYSGQLAQEAKKN